MAVMFKDLEEHVNGRMQAIKNMFDDESDDKFFESVFQSVRGSIESYVNGWFTWQQDKIGIDDGAEPFNSALDSIMSMLAAEMTYVLAFQYSFKD